MILIFFLFAPAVLSKEIINECKYLSRKLTDQSYKKSLNAYLRSMRSIRGCDYKTQLCFFDSFQKMLLKFANDSASKELNFKKMTELRSKVNPFLSYIIMEREKIEHYLKRRKKRAPGTNCPGEALERGAFLDDNQIQQKERIQNTLEESIRINEIKERTVLPYVGVGLSLGAMASYLTMVLIIYILLKVSLPTDTS